VPEHGFQGYTEPLRRFIQPEGYTPQVNEIPNTMPSWMPGEDYLINFQREIPTSRPTRDMPACLEQATKLSIQSWKDSTSKTIPT
jgi:hypothetical protein